MLHLLLPTTLHVPQYCFEDCANHSAGIVIVAQLAPLIVFPISCFIFPSFLLTDLARLLRHSLIESNITSIGFAGFLDVNHVFSAFII